MSLLTPGRLLRSLRKNPVILHGLIKNVWQDQARRFKDGPDGWSVVEIVCHLRDLEEVFYQRALRMLNEDTPVFESFDQNEKARQGDYTNQALNRVFEQLVENRRRTIQFFAELTPTQWQRTGIHPEAGPITLLEQAFQIGSHDTDHIEQIVRALGLAEELYGNIKVVSLN
ncbi:MAG: DinB family protein [Chloroflexi bacterium]|nr:DinB family protein [Chloroflexota bacterium]OJV94187.1 MAG: hypothetical protein BGO39_12035 [Chloroflexi bacterium 54-19]